MREFFGISEKLILQVLLVLTLSMFVLGISLPMISISKFILIKNTFSLLSGIFELLTNGRILIFLLVFAFSVVFPVIKFLLLFYLLFGSDWKSERMKKYLSLMHDYGRWAMLDVMVVAVLVVILKLGIIVNVKIHFGFALFSISVFLIMLITHRTVKLSKSFEDEAHLNKD